MAYIISVIKNGTGNQTVKGTIRVSDENLKSVLDELARDTENTEVTGWTRAT